MNERVQTGDRVEGLVREGEACHVRAEEGRRWNKRTGALDLHWREIHARDDVALRQSARDRNAAPASQIEDWRASGNPRLDQLEPSRVLTVVRVIGAVRARDQVVAAAHDVFRIIHETEHRTGTRLEPMERLRSVGSGRAPVAPEGPVGGPSNRGR